MPEYDLPNVAAIRSRWDKGITAKSDLDKESWQNIAFVLGDHYARWAPRLQQFIRPAPGERVRMKVNHVGSFWASQVSLLTESRPIAEVVSATDSDDDRSKAQVANRVLDAEFQRLNFDDLRDNLAAWVALTGWAYLHTCWDPTTDQATMEVVPHFEVVDPRTPRALRGLSSTQEPLWVIHGRALDDEEAFETYGKEFKAEGITIPSWQQLLSPSGSKAQGVLALRMWHKPCRKYPEGFVTTVVGGELVESMPYPYQHEELPFIDFHATRIPGRWAGRSTVVDLIPVQKDYNHSRSRLAELRSLFAGPKVLSPWGSLDIEKLSNKPGEVIQYKPVGPYKPEVWDPPQAPMHLFQTSDMAWREMQDLASQHSAGRGENPGSGIPAAGILALQERDDRKIARMIRGFELGVARAGRQLLMLCQQFWTTDRAIRVWSDELGSYKVERFMATDLGADLDVVVIPGSALPRSKEQGRQEILSLWHEKLIVDPRTVLKLLELPFSRAVLQAYDADARQAGREHDRIYRGELVPADRWHNHPIHITEHNNFRKEDSFEAWPTELKAVLADHVAEHEDRLREQAAEAQVAQIQMEQTAQMLMQTPGSTGSTGTPGMQSPMAGSEAGSGPLAAMQPSDGSQYVPSEAGVNTPLEPSSTGAGA